MTARIASGGSIVRVDVDNADLRELLALYAQIRDNLAKKLEAEIGLIESRLTRLRQERIPSRRLTANERMRPGTHAVP